MSKIWKVIFLIVLALVILGVIAMAIGYFTGGSVDRMIELVFGGRESLELIIQVLKEEIGPLLQ